MSTQANNQLLGAYVRQLMNGELIGASDFLMKVHTFMNAESPVRKVRYFVAPGNRGTKIIAIIKWARAMGDMGLYDAKVWAENFLMGHGVSRQNGNPEYFVGDFVFEIPDHWPMGCTRVNPQGAKVFEAFTDAMWPSCLSPV